MKMSLILWLLDVKKKYSFFFFDIENRTEPKPISWNWVQFGFCFFFQNFDLVVFISKNRTEPKMITLNEGNI